MFYKLNLTREARKIVRLPGKIVGPTIVFMALSSTRTSGRMRGFISYAHDDCAQFERLKTHLRSIELGYPIKFWSDQRLSAGYKWKSEIAQQIAAADVFVLLASPAFFGSDYILKQELPAIRNRRKALGHSLLLPVILEPCMWELIGGIYQLIPTDQGRVKPISEWKPKRIGPDQARIQIDAAIQRYHGAPPKPVKL